MNTRLYPPILAIALSLLLLAVAWHGSAQGQEAAPETPGAVAARLQQRYDAMHSLSFSFTQSTEGEMAGRPRRGSGHAVFLKGGETRRMRWDYDSPGRQVLVSDGETFSMYFEDLRQMIVSPAKAIEEDMTYSFFTGSGQLTENFAILGPNRNTVEGEETAGLRIIQLVPKAADSQVQDIHLWISEDSLIRRIEIRDQFDTLTILTFSDIREAPLAGENAAALAALFSFSPPEGTEIIHQDE